MNFHNDQIMPLHGNDQFAYYYPMYDSYVSPFWRYPVPQYEIPLPMPYYGMNNLDLREQIRSTEESSELEINKQKELGTKNKDQREQSEKMKVVIKKQQQKQDIGQGYQTYNIKMEERSFEHLSSNVIEVKTDLTRLFNLYLRHLKQYNAHIDYLMSVSPLHNDLYRTIDQKIKNFKKSKEEMIKMIIRRTQRYYKTVNQTKKDPRFVKYGGFKSMNSGYLKTIFSDQLFLQAFEIVASKFKEEFIQENNVRIAVIANQIFKIKQPIQIDRLNKILTEKNKMPWPQIWVEKMFATIMQLYQNYGKQNREIMNTLKIEEQLDSI